MKTVKATATATPSNKKKRKKEEEDEEKNRKDEGCEVQDGDEAAAEGEQEPTDPESTMSDQDD